MSDKEILLQAVEHTSRTITSQLFGIDNMATQTLIKYVTKNMADKYNVYLDAITDGDGNINMDVLGDAAKSVMHEKGGIKLGKIKFTEQDIDQLILQFKDLKSKN